MKSTTKLLITTALDATWGSQQNIIFLGEWCKKYSMKNLWQSREYETLDYHWRDRSKLAKDHHYLESLNEEALLAMTLFLNKFHGVEKSVRYWRIIIGPWLLSYISVLWDRWEAVSRAIELDDELETFVLEKALKRATPDDFVAFRSALDSDGWNHGIFADILMERSPSNIKTITLNNPLPVEIILPQLKLTLLQKLFPILASLAESFTKRVSSKSQKVLFFHSYFPRKHLLYFYYKLRLIPLWHSPLKQKIKYPDSTNRGDLTLDTYKIKNDFESYLCKSIIGDIPVAYLEGYSSLSSMAKTFIKAEVIFTANAHFGNELFKVWSAEQVLAGSKLIISPHGGSLYPLYSMFGHEDKIADSRIVWGKEWSDHQTRMPPNKLYFKVKNYNQHGEILLIDYEATRYGFRCVSCPVGPLVLDSFEHNNQFLQSLDKTILSNLKVRPKYLGSWETALRYKDNFGIKIISKEPTILKDMQGSKLIVCTYPQTAFSEAMYSGVPTMLLLVKDHWQFQPIYDDLLEELERAKILYFNPVDAAKHLAEIYPNPQIWWESSDVLLARKKFDEICLTITENPLNQWTMFLKNIDSK